MPPEPTTDPTPNLDAAPADDHLVPNDNTSMLEVLKEYEDAGYGGQFSVVEGNGQAGDEGSAEGDLSAPAVPPPAASS